jgi:biotin operon repressor
MKIKSFEEVISEAKKCACNKEDIKNNLCTKCGAEHKDVKDANENINNFLNKKTLNFYDFQNDTLLKTEKCGDENIKKTEKDSDETEKTDKKVTVKKTAEEIKESVIDFLTQYGVKISLNKISEKLEISIEELIPVMKSIKETGILVESTWDDKKFYKIKSNII